MQTIQSWSGGKDSTASIILEHIYGLPCSTVIFSEVMFDRRREISGEQPEHISWVRNKAIPLLESWGYEVKILRADKDFLDLFYNKPVKSKHPERRDKYSGFLLGGKCAANRDLKIRPIKEFLRSIEGEYTQYVGIAADEPKRLARLEGTNKVSLLQRYGYTEQMALDLCKQYGLLSPIYDFTHRGGCWFCPLATISEYAYTKQHHPELWEKLRQLSHTENLVSSGFKYGLTFAQVDANVDGYIEQQEAELLQITLEEFSQWRGKGGD